LRHCRVAEILSSWAKEVKEYIDKNNTQAGLDRLHTFTVKFVRSLCGEHGITVDRDKVLHRSSWRSYTFGVALGYGIYSAVDLVLAAIRLEYGESIWHIHSVLSTLAFNGMLITWLWYIRQSKEVAQPVRVIPYNDIAKWNEKLEQLLKRKAAWPPASSSLPWCCFDGE
jgi:hypothetical protein